MGSNKPSEESLITTRSNNFFPLKDTMPTASNGLGGAASASSGRFNYGASISVGRFGQNSSDSWSLFSHQARPVQGPAEDLKSSSKAAASNRSSRPQPDTGKIPDGKKGKDGEKASSSDASSESPRTRKGDDASVPTLVNLSNKRHHDQEQDIPATESSTLKEVTLDLEYHKNFLKRPKIHRTGAEALRASSDVEATQHNSHLSSGREANTKETMIHEDIDLLQPAPNSFHSDHQIPKDASLRSNNSLALIRSSPGNSSPSSKKGNDWYFKVLAGNQAVVAQFQAGKQEKQALEMKLAKIVSAQSQT